MLASGHHSVLVPRVSFLFQIDVFTIAALFLATFGTVSLVELAWIYCFAL
jgi:hypothetical protein